MLTIYASNTRVSKCREQKLIQLNKPTITAVNFNTLLPVIDILDTSKIRKDIED